MKFEQTSQVRGDECASYSVTDYKAKTVCEFIDEVLQNTREWGYINIALNGVSWLNYPACEYRYGNLVTILPTEYMDKEITKVDGDGGWSRMDYYVYIKE